MALGLGYMLAGGLMGSAQEVGQIADQEITKRNNREAAWAAMDDKLRYAEAIAKRDADAYAAAEGAVIDEAKAGSISNVRAGLPEGAADALPEGMLEDMAGETPDMTTSKSRQAVYDKLRREGTASAGLLESARKERDAAVSSEKQARAESAKEAAARRNEDFRLILEDRKDAREQARLDARAESEIRRIEAAAEKQGKYNVVGDQIKYLTQVRTGLDNEARAARDIVKIRLDSTMSPKEKQRIMEEFDAEMADITTRKRELDKEISAMGASLNLKPAGEAGAGAATKPNRPKESVKIVDTLPTSGVPVGAIARNRKTGETMVFNGKSWEPKK